MGAVTDGIRAEIAQLRVEDEAPGLAELAESLARSVDASEDAPSARAMAAKELRAVMGELRKLALAREEGDALDDLAARRAARRGA
jgi:hypothetical protein